MKSKKLLPLYVAFVFVLTTSIALTYAKKQSSYAPVVITEDFDSVVQKMEAEKAPIMKRQMKLLNERYDLTDRPANGVTMSRGKAVQQGTRAKLHSGMTWQKLAEMTPEQIREKNLFPKGFMPLPHPNHNEGGMLFPQFVIDEILNQEGRDLTRFDLDYDLPEHLLPEYPAAVYLTTRLDLGDVSQGKVITINNY